MDYNYFTYEGKIYKIIYKRKRIKNVIFHLNDDVFNISLPYREKEEKAYQLLNRYVGKKLIERSVKKNYFLLDKYIYVFGEKKFCFPNGKYFILNKYISFNTIDEFYEKIKAQYLEYLIDRVNYFKSKMGITTNYLIKVRKMKRTFGNNCKSKKTLTFSFVLIHYSKEVIDSVVIHELAHDLFFDHSSNFYNVVYNYCPNYDILRKQLVKGEFL